MPQEKYECNSLREAKISPKIEGWNMFFCVCSTALILYIYPKSEISTNEALKINPNSITILSQKLEKLKTQIPKSY